MTGWTATPDEDDPCSCGDELAHCHGVLVVHATGVVECDEAGCTAEVQLHAWQLSCCEIEGGCRCDAELTVMAPRRRAPARAA